MLSLASLAHQGMLAQVESNRIKGRRNNRRSRSKPQCMQSRRGNQKLIGGKKDFKTI